MEKTVSPPVLDLSGASRIAADPSHGSLHSWRQDTPVCFVGFLEFKAIPVSLRIKCGEGNASPVTRCEHEAYVTNSSLQVLHSPSQCGLLCEAL